MHGLQASMLTQAAQPQAAPSTADEDQICALYQQLLNSWNQRDAAAFAANFAQDANIVGFDGSQMSGRSEITAMLGDIFAHHQTAAYVGKVREVCLLSADVAILRAVVGMVPPGGSDINPAVNAIQSLVASKQAGAWRIVLFQNTPAQFHGRPELSAALTEELRQLLSA